MEETTTNTPATPAAGAATTTDPKAGDTTTGATTEQPKNDVTSTDTGSRDNLPKGVKRRLWEQAERNREQEAQIAAMRAELDALKATSSTKTEPDPELLDNPQAWADKLKKAASESAKQEVLSQIRQEQEAERMKVEHEKGLQYILSHKEIADSDDAQTEITEILQRPDMAYIASRYPNRAAELAVDEWKKSKGISETRKAAASQNAASSTSTATASTGAGKKVWTRAEIKSYLADFNSPDFAQREAEVKLAQREGRIK